MRVSIVGLAWGSETEGHGRGWQLADLLGGSVARVRSFARETTSTLLAASALLPPLEAAGAYNTHGGAITDLTGTLPLLAACALLPPLGTVGVHHVKGFCGWHVL